MKITRRDLLKVSAAGLLGGTAVACQAGSEPETNIEEPVVDPLAKEAPVIDESDYAKRMEKAQRLLVENKMDGLMVTGGTALKYFSGINWWTSERMFAMVILPDSSPVFVCPAFEVPRASEQIKEGSEILGWEEHESPYELVKGIFRGRNNLAARLGIEEKSRFFEADGIAKIAPGFELVSGDPVTAGCRAVKSAKELDILRRANQLTVKVYERIVNRFEEGMTEAQTRAITREEFAASGVSGGAGPMHGSNSAFPHGTANRITLEKGMIVLMDGGFKLNGYSADITRTIVFGEPSDRQRKVWDLVKKAQEAALDAARAGNTCGSVDDAARKVITDGGFGPDYKYFTHRLGHGIGMDGHEWPYLVRGNDLILEPGMTFSNEPGIYIYGEFGVRLEDIMYIDENGEGRLFTEASPSIDKPFQS